MTFRRTKILQRLTAAFTAAALMMLFVSCTDPVIPLSADCSITDFSLDCSIVRSSLDESSGTIEIFILAGNTNLSSLTPTVTHTGASVSPESGELCDFT